MKQVILKSLMSDLFNEVDLLGYQQIEFTSNKERVNTKNPSRAYRWLFENSKLKMKFRAEVYVTGAREIKVICSVQRDDFQSCILNLLPEYREIKEEMGLSSSGRNRIKNFIRRSSDSFVVALRRESIRQILMGEHWVHNSVVER